MENNRYQWKITIDGYNGYFWQTAKSRDEIFKELESFTIPTTKSSVVCEYTIINQFVDNGGVYTIFYTPFAITQSHIDSILPQIKNQNCSRISFNASNQKERGLYINK